MKGQAVARILFVITLIVTAHTIRPFSMKNLTSHLLYSTRSFAVVLPDSTRSSFDYANTLAVALSQSMFVDAADVQTPSIPRTNFTAMAKAAPILEPQDVVEIEPVVKTGVSNQSRSNVLNLSLNRPGPILRLIIPSLK